MQETSLTLEIGWPGEGSIGEANKADLEEALDSCAGGFSHECQGCPERCFNVWRSRGHQAVRRTLHSQLVKRKVRRASNVVIRGLIGCSVLWLPKPALSSSGACRRLGAIPAPSVDEGAVALPVDAEARRPLLPARDPKALSPPLLHAKEALLLSFPLPRFPPWAL
jgi:hypothetical protein